MNELFELIEKLKEERSISSGTQDVFKKFIGKEYEANLSFISASRTFSLRYDDSYSNGYTVNALIEGKGCEVNVLFLPVENKKIEELKKGENFEATVYFIEYDSLYERAVFGSNPQIISETVSSPEWINRDIATSEELKSDGSDLDELIAAKLNDIEANQPTVAADVHSLEVDGKLKLIPANKVDLIIHEINQAKNSWVFMSGNNQQWSREFFSYTINSVPINEGDKIKPLQLFKHWKGNSWKEQSFIKAPDASRRLKLYLENDSKFNDTSSIKSLPDISIDAELDWSSNRVFEHEDIDDVLTYLKTFSNFWTLTASLGGSGYSDFIQYLRPEIDSEGVFERWRNGEPVLREVMSSELAMKRAEAYLKQKEYLCAAYYQFLEEKDSKDKFDNVRKPKAKVSKSNSKKGNGFWASFLAITFFGWVGMAEQFSAEGAVVFFFLFIMGAVILILKISKS